MKRYGRIKKMMKFVRRKVSSRRIEETVVGSDPLEKGIVVSYVITNYRGEDILPRCLDSVLSQEVDVTREIIVVDDASDDGSVALLRRDYPQVKVVESGRNKGCSGARNLGARAAAGDFIAFLDNDVELQPGWTRAMLDRFAREDESLGACASHILFMHPPERINSAGGMMNLLGHAWERGRAQEDAAFSRYPLRVIYPCGAAFMVRRSVLEEVGWFDERLSCAYDDVDIGWRMNLFGYRILYEPRAEARHRVNTTLGGGTPFNKYQYERNRLRSMLKNMEGKTLRLLAGEYLYWFLHQTAWEARRAPSLRSACRLWMNMCRAVGWNLVFLPDTLHRRREIASRRKVSDRDLLRGGILQAQVGAPPSPVPPVLKEGRMRREGEGPYPRKLVMGKRGEEALREGWHEREKDGRGLTFRWTQERARVLLQGRGKEKELRIFTIMGHPHREARALVRLNGNGPTEIRVSNQPRLHHITLPREDHSKLWEVEIQALDPFSPREALEMEDLRRLGIAVVSMSLH